MKVKVLSYRNLFGSNTFISAWESSIIIKDSTKYLPLDIVHEEGLIYYDGNVQEIEI